MKSEIDIDEIKEYLSEDELLIIQEANAIFRNRKIGWIECYIEMCKEDWMFPIFSIGGISVCIY